MKLFASEKYSNKSAVFPNPEDNRDPKDKVRDKTWYKEKCEYIYSLYLRDQCGIPYSRVTDYETYRLYGQGRQPVEKYMNVLCPRDKKTGIRKMWMNISWDILSVAPKYRGVVLGRLSKVDYKPQCMCVDELSDEARNNIKFGVWIEKKHQEFLAQFDQITGAKPDPQQQEIPFMPDTMQELDMMANMGAFKLKHEIAMEKMMDAGFRESLWEEIKKKLYEDFFDLGVAATKDFVNPDTQKVECRYVDPINLIVHYSRSNSFEDITEAGEMKLYSLATIQQLTGMSADEIKQVAQSYYNYYGNTGGYYSRLYQENRWDHNKVLVMDVEFESDDTRVFKNTIDKNGNPIVDEKGFNYKPAADSAIAKGVGSVDRIAVKQWYRCKWIVGTDIIFDYGYQYDVPRMRKNKPCSSYHMYKVADKSMLASIIVPLDQIQFNYLKLQNDIAKAPPAGIKVEFGSLSNMSLGEEKMGPLDILSIYRQTGDLLYKRTTQNGQILQGAERPIEELKGGLGPVLDERIKIFEFNFNLIRDITGINAVVDASAPSPGALNGTSEIAASATDNVLQAMLHGYKNIKVATARNFAKRIQIISRFGDPSRYYDVLGANNMEIIRLGAGNELSDYGIYVEGAITDEQRQFIRNAALASLQAAKTGSVGITMKDLMFIERMLEADQIKYAEFYLGGREEQEFQKQQAVAAQNQKMNADGAQAIEKQKAEAAQLTIQTQGAIDANKIHLQAEKDKEVENVKHQNKMAEIALTLSMEHESAMKVQAAAPKPTSAAA